MSSFGWPSTLPYPSTVTVELFARHPVAVATAVAEVDEAPAAGLISDKPPNANPVPARSSDPKTAAQALLVIVVPLFLALRAGVTDPGHGRVAPVSECNQTNKINRGAECRLVSVGPVSVSTNVVR
jgi:hypothetical protein